MPRVDCDLEQEYLCLRRKTPRAERENASVEKGVKKMAYALWELYQETGKRPDFREILLEIISSKDGLEKFGDRVEAKFSFSRLPAGHMGRSLSATCRLRCIFIQSGPFYRLHRELLPFKEIFSGMLERYIQEAVVRLPPAEYPTHAVAEPLSPHVGRLLG